MVSTFKGTLGGERQPRGTLLLVLHCRHCFLFQVLQTLVFHDPTTVLNLWEVGSLSTQIDES